jgi:transposase InsO family protein
MLQALLKRDGFEVGRLHVATLMKTMGIEALYRRPNTSKPAPGHKVFPYLLRKIPVTAPNQVWAMDITYVPMARGFVYLAAVVDWFSRRVLAWRLSISMAEAQAPLVRAPRRTASASRRWRRRWPAMASPRSSTPTREASLRRWRSRAC